VVKQRKDVIFLLMGGNPDQVQRYRRQVNVLGLAANFRFAGLRSQSEVLAALRLAHVLVSPRINGTNTPLKIYSYLQSGKPIVATNSSSHRQVLSDSAALFVEAEPVAFASGILSLFDDPALADGLGATGRQVFRNKYSYEQFLQKTDHIIRSALR
jgi:glycosyltransferase involved in cell wall biosynthesis